MSNTITFILPSLVETHCHNFLDDSAAASVKQLNKLLRRSSKKPVGTLQNWLSEQFKLPENYSDSAKLMALGEGFATVENQHNSYWLRADPVMLQATHNGILCRGNWLLNLTPEERVSIENVVNDFFQDQGIELKLFNSRQGLLRFNEKPGSHFTSLLDTIGQDITHRLPKGDNAPYWHRLLTDLQMLLHNCDVNQQRSHTGQQQISGFWLWGEEELTRDSAEPFKQAEHLYTDDSALAGYLGNTSKLSSLPQQFDAPEHDQLIHVSELQEAYLQNHQEAWTELFSYWTDNWLLPALKSVDEGQLAKVMLIPADGNCYEYSKGSRWCFWRRHSFIPGKGD